MTLGVGTSGTQDALALLSDRTQGVQPIAPAEYQKRLARARQLMREQELDALYLHAGTSLTYFTGTQWNASERMVAAVLPAEGELAYIAPAFERETLGSFMGVAGRLACWEEHESPYQLLTGILKELGTRRLGIAENTPFFTFDGIRQACPDLDFVDAACVTRPCRSRKSASELALIQRAMDMTLEVHANVATILRPGITVPEVVKYIDDAHRAVGAAGSSFCIVLFGRDSASPHGVQHPKALEENDVVLIDTGCLMHGYHSDITRTYVFGDPDERQRQVWNAEQAAQAAAFEAATLGTPCGDVDSAARAVIEREGFGPGYALPGLPHRTGHGLGLDIHEGPYLVRNDRTPLAPGMCFSNEPMICVPGEFGVRLEDHFYMTEQGARWFTKPSHSIDDPFALGV